MNAVDANAARTAAFAPYALAALRIMTALLLLQHGLQKYFGFPVMSERGLAEPLSLTGLAGALELVGGSLILIGLFTRPAAFLASGMAAVGYWVAHGSKGLYPIANGGETIALYCFIFLFIATRGAGIWSVDGAKK